MSKFHTRSLSRKLFLDAGLFLWGEDSATEFHLKRTTLIPGFFGPKTPNQIFWDNFWYTDLSKCLEFLIIIGKMVGAP